MNTENSQAQQHNQQQMTTPLLTPTAKDIHLRNQDESFNDGKLITQFGLIEEINQRHSESHHQYYYEQFNSRERILLAELERQDYANVSESTSNQSFNSSVRCIPQRKILLMNVKKGVSFINIISMLLVIANQMIAAVFLFFSSIYYLQNPNYFGLAKTESAAVAGDLIFYSYPFAMIFDLTSGYVYNIFGRKYTIFVGFTLCSTFMIITPLYITTLYPGLHFSMVMINLAHALVKNHPLIADYIKQDSRGIATALVSVSSSMGALIAIKFLFGELKELDYKYSCIIVAVINFIVAIFLLFGVKDLYNTQATLVDQFTHTLSYEQKQLQKKLMIEEDDNDEQQQSHRLHQQIVHVTNKQKIILKTKLMFQYIKQDSTYAICFSGMFVSDMGFLLSSVYINAWVSTYFDNTEEGILQAKDLVEELSSLTIFMGVLIGLLFGFLSDKLSIVGLLISSFSIRAAGLLMMPFVARVRFFLFMCTLCLNVGNSVEAVVVSSLLNKSLYLPIREVMNGFAISFRTLGVLFVSKFGGILFERVRIYGPFVMVGICDLIFILFVILMKITHKFNK